MTWKSVKATREGLLGKLTAASLVIRHTSVFVALPSVRALWKIVAVRYNNIIVLAPVLDIGTWFIDDDDYVFGSARPRAEYTPHTNGSGIDLSDEIIYRFGFNPVNTWDNYTVDWKFIEPEDINAS